MRIATAGARAAEPGLDLEGRIVFSSDRAGGNLELFTMAADGSSVRRLTTTPANEMLPAWSPDGTEIAFLSFQDDLESLDADASPAEIKVMRAVGSRVRTLTTPEPHTGAITWSPDGERIAFAAQGNIHVMRADGSQRHVLPDAEGDEDWPSWSPDGKLILVTSSTPGPEQLSTIPADGSDPTPLQQPGSEGAWSPDGQEHRLRLGPGRRTRRPRSRRLERGDLRHDRGRLARQPHHANPRQRSLAARVVAGRNPHCLHLGRLQRQLGDLIIEAGGTGAAGMRPITRPAISSPPGTDKSGVAATLAGAPLPGGSHARFGGAGPPVESPPLSPKAPDP